MKLRELNDRREITRLYRERMVRDFPDNERKPLGMLLRGLRRREYVLYGLCEGEDLLGYAIFYVLRDGQGESYLFDYLAIDEARRDAGLGTAFLRLLAETLRGAVCVLGEVEDPAAAPDEAARAQRLRRLDFYRRNGCRETGLRCRLFGVDYLVLELPAPDAHDQETLRERYAAIYQQMLPKRFLRRHFLLH